MEHVYDELHGIDESAECALCGRPAQDGTLCGECFEQSWTFASDDEADAHARDASVQIKLASLTLGRECIECGDRIEAALFDLGSTKCAECRPHRQAA